MSGSEDHGRIRELFDELSAALEARGVRIEEAKDEVLAAAKTVAERNGLDDNSLDLEAAQFVPRGDEVRAKTVYDSRGIVVTAAAAEYLLAMKVFAAREPDLQDIKAPGRDAWHRRDQRRDPHLRAYPGWVSGGEDAQRVDAVADAREERGEPLPEVTLEAGRRQRDATGDRAGPRGARPRRAAARAPQKRGWSRIGWKPSRRSCRHPAYERCSRTIRQPIRAGRISAPQSRG